jgi:hypothetical protein
VHVTARVTRKLTSVKQARIHAAVRLALTRSLARTDFRIVHLSVQPTRLELVVEADDRVALARGMQGFQVSAAKLLNRLARRSGTVFADRYRMRILATRRQVRDAIGRLSRLRQASWPQTWLLRVALAPVPARRWFHTRADEDSRSRDSS